MRVLLIAGLLLTLLARPLGAEPGDYRVDSPAWNGLSRFVAQAQDAGCSISQASSLDWARLGTRDVLFFVYPQGPIDPEALGDYLTRGGRVLLADDFGAAGPAFEALQLHRTAARLEGVPREPGHPELPVARVSLLTSLGRSTPQLVANHPAAFETALPATYALSPAQALVVEGHVGKGRFVALADPSVLINNMLELPGNAAFAKALFAELCNPGSDGDRVHLLLRAFRVEAAAPRPRTDDAGVLGRLNDVAASLNRAAEDLLRGLFALPAALLLCGAACAVGWRALVRGRQAQHGDGAFTRTPGSGGRGAWALIDAQPRGEGRADELEQRDDYALALSALRIELLRRVAAQVGTLSALQPRADRLERVQAALGPGAGSAYAAFLSIGPAGDGPIERRVPRATFFHAMTAARAVLAALAGQRSERSNST